MFTQAPRPGTPRPVRLRSSAEDEAEELGAVARRTAVTTLVAVGIVVLALALWKIRLIIALTFLAFTIAAAMRPGVERLHQWRVPRSIGILLHYAALVGLIAGFLWLVAPHAVTQVQQALDQSRSGQLAETARHSNGLKRQALLEIQKRLKRLPSGSSIVHPAISATRTAIEVVVGIFFAFAGAAYWIFERDKTIDLVAKLIPRPRRRTVRETWQLIDLKLGAFVRGQLLLIVFVSCVLSFAFWLDGMPYWLLVGVFAGVFEIVPFIGPLVVGAVAIGVGATAGWQTAVGAAIAVIALRLLQDYFISPKVLGGAVGLSPLLVIFSVTAIGILLGGLYVLLAIPITSALATLVQVAVLGMDPEEAEVPTVIFPAADAEPS